MGRVAVIGSSNIDLVTRSERLPEAGETLAATSFSLGHGGKGANQAVAAAKLGGDVVFVSRVGDDLFGAQLRAAYGAAGLDTRHVSVTEGSATGTATILVDPSGENRILIAPGANAALSPADIDAAADRLAACGLIVLQLEIPLATVIYAIEWAAKAGIDVLLNPAPARADLDIGRLAAVAFLVPNQSELALLTGRPAGTRAEAEAAAGALVARGIRTVIVTLGGDGALVVGADGARHVPAIAVTPRDTTGAGDAFIGAFAERWAATRDIVAAVDQATRYAADSITRPGTQASYADRATFDRAPGGGA